MSQAPIAPKLGNPMQDELQRTLGASRPGVSNTMPVKDMFGKPFGGTQQAPTPAAATRGPQRMEGFDLVRPQDIKKSAKDSFAFHSQAAPTAPTGDKAALAQWMDQYVRPGMNADGHNVYSVDGDKFRFKNWQGDFDVDYGRGAGAEDGALAFQATDMNAPAGGGAPAIGNQNMAPVMPGQGSDLMAQLMAALQAQQEQPIDPQSLLLEQLR